MSVFWPYHFTEVAAIVEQRYRTDQEPSKRPVGSSQASLELSRFTFVE
jgi:hypothetical protein